MIELTLDNGETAAIECVLFDNDGTLVDTQELLLLSFRHAIGEVLGKQLPDEEYLAGVGTPLADQMNGFAAGDPVVAERLLEVYRTFNHRIHDEMIVLFPGIEELLKTLKGHGVTLGVVTSKLHALAEHGLQVLGIDGYFDIVVGADDWPEHKPQPGPLVHACDLVGIDPAKCAYVGDSPYDMKASNGAGCVTVAALWGMFSRAVLMEDAPAIVCATPDELRARIGGSMR